MRNQEKYAALNEAVTQLVRLSQGDAWLKAASARALGVRASGSGSYTLSDAVVDSERSDAEQELATILLLTEDSLVNGVLLAFNAKLSVEALEKLLQLALACDLDIRRASLINDRGAQPVWKCLSYVGSEEPAASVAGLLAQYVESAKKKQSAKK